MLSPSRRRFEVNVLGGGRMDRRRKQKASWADEAGAQAGYYRPKRDVC